MVKNIVDRYVNIVKEEFKDYSKIILGTRFNAEIFNVYIENYIEARYYNFTDDDNIRTFRDKILNEIQNTKNELLNKGIFDENIVIFQGEIFNNLLSFDNVSIVQSEESAKKNLNEIYEQRHYDHNFNNQFLDKNIYYENFKNKLKEKYESTVFYIKYKKLDMNVYLAELKYNIKFPKVYNLDFIRNAFNTGITNEDKLEVEYSILSKVILNEILNHNFKRKYIAGLPESLLLKDKKIKGILNTINSPAIQEKISLMILYKTFVYCKNQVYSLMKQGYKFSVCLDDTFEVNYADLERLNMFDFVILKTELENYDEIIENKKIIRNLIEV